MITLVLVLTTGHLFWSPAYGKEQCNTEFETSCARRVRCSFNENVIKEKREFRIEYKGPGQVQEVIADCQWRKERFTCDPAKGFSCDTQMSNNFSVLIDTAEKCLTEGEILFDVAHEQAIRCNLSNNKVTTDFGSELYTTQPTNNPISGNGETGVTIGIITGLIGLLVVCAIAAFCLWRRRSRKSKMRGVPDKTDGMESQENEEFMDENKAVKVSEDNRGSGCFATVQQFLMKWFGK